MRELIGDIVDAGYADVARRIYDIWPYPECPEYLNKLLLQDRLEPRQGFPKEVISALMELQELRGTGQPNDIWGHSK